MGLRLRINLMLTSVFVVGLLVTGYGSYNLLQRQAQAEVVHSAELMIEAANAIRGYTIDDIRPHLYEKLETEFLPQIIPAYAATEVLRRFSDEHSDYVYKEATLNPTNPRDRAVDWEADVINKFKREATLKSYSGVRQTPDGSSLFIASPIKIANEACLTCHSLPSVAPATMIASYGSANGFGWKAGEIVGAQIVSVPMSVPIANANKVFTTLMLSFCGVFVTLYIVLNLMLSRLIIRPIRDMAVAAESVSTGNFDIEEFAENRTDEVGQLGRSFNRMRRSLKQAMRMIES